MSGADDQRGAEPDQCRYCPNDADRDEAGFLHCIECGWTDNPGKVVGLHETIDRLRDELRAAGDALADELERSTGISDPDVQALVATYRAACDAAPADEIDRLRARVAELEAASPDDAHTDEMVCEVCTKPLMLSEPKYVHADGKTYRHPIRPVSATTRTTETCDECGAFVVDDLRHSIWHDWLRDELERAE